MSDVAFSQWQPVYAEHGIATIPCADRSKRPLVKHPDKFGCPGSTKIASKFADAQTFGFYTGPRSGITVLDVDIANENILAAALDRHGSSPIIVRTGSGKFHALYRHNGERRCIRPWGKELEIDLLGATGLCIAPPSIGAKGQYEIIQGSLDDLDRLPIMRGLEDRLYQCDHAGPRPQPRGDWSAMRAGDGRNNALFNTVLDHARWADDYDQLLDYARTRNEGYGEPMTDAEVVTITNNAWKIQTEGRNRKGAHGVWFPTSEANDLIKSSPDDYLLLSYLRANNKPDATFWITNGLAETFGWSRQRLAAARESIIRRGYVRRLRTASNNAPALYRWDRARLSTETSPLGLLRSTSKQKGGARAKGWVEDRCLISDTPTFDRKTLT
jgi:Bifunctional DNA primase/polymerase, N-terminal